MNKPFGQDLYDKYDLLAREIVKTALMGHGWKVEIPDEELYQDGDLIGHVADKSMLLEVELRPAWGDCRWTWPDVHVPARKIASKSKIYFTVNGVGSMMGACLMSDIHASPIRKLDNKYSNKEPFFVVSNERFDFYQLQEGGHWVQTQWLNGKHSRRPLLSPSRHG